MADTELRLVLDFATEADLEAILDFLNEADEDGEFDFAFNTKREVRHDRTES